MVLFQVAQARVGIATTENEYTWALLKSPPTIIVPVLAE